MVLIMVNTTKSWEKSVLYFKLRIADLEEKQKSENNEAAKKDRAAAIEQKKQKMIFWLNYPKMPDNLSKLFPIWIKNNPNDPHAISSKKTYLEKASKAILVISLFEESNFSFEHPVESDTYIKGEWVNEGLLISAKISPEGLLIHGQRLNHKELLIRQDFNLPINEIVPKAEGIIKYIQKNANNWAERFQYQTAAWELERSTRSLKYVKKCMKCGAKTPQSDEIIQCCGLPMVNISQMPPYIIYISTTKNNEPKLPYNKKEENGWHYEQLRCMNANEKTGKYTYIVENEEDSLYKNLNEIGYTLLSLIGDLKEIGFQISELEFNLSSFEEYDQKLIKLCFRENYAFVKTFEKLLKNKLEKLFKNTN